MWVSVCDFELRKLIGLYQFVEEDAGEPFFKILCRSILNDLTGDGIVYLSTDDEARCPDLTGKYALDVEVLVQPGKLKTTTSPCSPPSCRLICCAAGWPTK